MPLQRNKNTIILLLSIVAIVAGLGAELLTGGRLYAGWLYFGIVLITYFTGDLRAPVVAGTVAAVSILISLLFIPDAWQWWQFANVIAPFAGIGFCVFFVRYVLLINQKAGKDTKQVKSMFTHATEGIVLTNRNREILLVNPYAERMFGYTADELEGSKIEILLPEQVRARHEGHVSKFHEHPMNRSMGAGRDLFARRKDGSVFPVEVSLSHYNSGKESFAIAFIIDITIRKQGEEMLKQKNEELETVSSQIKQLNTELEQKVEDRTMMLRETLEQLERSKMSLQNLLKRKKSLVT